MYRKDPNYFLLSFDRFKEGKNNNNINPCKLNKLDINSKLD